MQFSFLHDLAAGRFIISLPRINHLSGELLIGARVHKQITLRKTSTPYLLLLDIFLFFAPVAIGLYHYLLCEH